eukprot:COSAG02_NODE_987_length_15443_cov_8.132625_1_plen_433_part_00
MAILKEGPVEKWKDADGVWKARHLELQDGPVLTYHAKKGKRALGRIEVQSVTVSRAHSATRQHAFEVRGQDGELAAFATRGKAESEQWVAVIQNQVPHPPDAELEEATAAESSSDEAEHCSSTDSDHAHDDGTPPSARKTVMFSTGAHRPAEREQAEHKSAMKPVTPPASMLTAASSWDTSAPTVRNSASPVPPLAFDFGASVESDSDEEDSGAVNEAPAGPDELTSQPSLDTQRAPVAQGVLERLPHSELAVADSRPQMGAGLTLDLVQHAKEPPTPRTDGAALMTGTPRTPRGSIPYETELLREQLEEQLAMTTALREQVEASSAEAAVKQLRENWLLAEDRADQHRARLTDVCLQQVPSLKRELAALSSENTVLRGQVTELMDELQEATTLGHELAMATPRQEEVNSVRKACPDLLREEALMYLSFCAI